MECPTGKVPHTLKTAKAASKRARRRTETILKPYRCAECGQWHVGQASGMKQPLKVIYSNHELRAI